MRAFPMLTIALGLVLHGAPALAYGGHQTPADGLMPAGEVADPPTGYSDLCERNASLCASLGGFRQQPFANAARTTPTAKYVMHLASACGILGKSGIKLAGGCPAKAAPLPEVKVVKQAEPVQPALDEHELRKLARKINRTVNDNVVQRTDYNALGVGEYWRRTGTEYGAFGDCEDLALEKRIRLLDRGFPADRLYFAVAYGRNIGMHTVLVARLEEGDFVLDSLSGAMRRWSSTGYSFVRMQSTANPMVWYRVGRPARYESRLAANEDSDPDYQS